MPTFDRVVTTTCPYCGVGCNLELHIKNGRIARVTSPFDHPVNHGNLCVKGRFGLDFVHHPDRLSAPLIRRDGALRSATWDEALSLVAGKLSAIKAESGPDAIAILCSAKCTNEDNYLMQKFARQVIGTNNVDHCARLCHASTVTGLVQAFGSGAMTNSIGDLAQAEAIFTIGTNTTEQHPIIGLQIKRTVRQRGAALIVADPRKIELTQFATLHLQHEPGTDLALLNGLAYIIIEENLHDADFVAARTENFDAWKAVVDEYPPDVTSRITRVPTDDLVRAARILGTHKPAAALYAMGITQHTCGHQNVTAVANLQMLLGNMGVPGGGVNPLRGQNNVQGACDVGGLPDVYPGYQRVSDPAVRAKFEEAWAAPQSPNAGLTVVEMMDAAGAGRLRALYFMGENPAMSDPDSNHVRACLESVEFLVCQDIFLNETGQYADVVFPAASFAEKDGTFTNTERRIQRVRSALEPPGQARPDWQILIELAERMGVQGWDYAHPSEIMAEIASLTPIYGGISYEGIDKIGLQWPCPTPGHPGTPILHVGRFSRGKGNFSPAPHQPARELPDDEYPFMLTTGRRLQHWHGGTMTRRVGGLDFLQPEERVEIHPDDAAALGVSNGDWVRITSRRGQVRARACVLDRTRRGLIFMTFHFVEALANELTIAALDPIAKIPEYKVCAVRVEREECQEPEAA